MGAAIIDGKAHAAALRMRIAAEVERFHAAAGRAPGLAVVLVGDDPASAVYVRNKAKATREAGMEGFEHRLPATVTADELVALVDRLNADPAVDGILVQLPLPPHIDEHRVTTRIDPDKDVDGFHPVNVGRLTMGLHGFVPCTPLGCVKLLHEVRGDLAGLDAVVIGRSNIVGKPMAQLLLRESCTVTVTHSRTRDIAAHVRRADIVVAAVGIPGFVEADWIKPGRDGHRRRHQSHRGRAGRRCRLRARGRGGGGDHAGAGWGRTDDDRLPAAQHAGVGVPARGCGVREGSCDARAAPRRGGRHSR